MSEQKKLFVVDDDADVGQTVKGLLEAKGYKVQLFGSAAEALVALKKEQPRVILTDLRMKDIDGMMFVRKVRQDYPSIVCIMMTAFGSIETAIEAMKAGAYHYIVKPFNMDELALLVGRAFEHAHLIQENKTLRKELRKEFTTDSMIGKSQIMQDLFELIKRVASAHANVLVMGESGSGKELVARAIHNLGPRKNGPFVPLNCTAIPEQLLESELFGHVKGSFTGAIADKKGIFEEAKGGTLFLDEIGDLSLHLQAKLLRVLQDKQIRPVGGLELKNIDVRLIAATHRDLKSMVSEGKFREDLFYRLNVIPVRVPALRERQQDIPILVDHFITKFSAENGSSVRSMSPEAMARLMAHSWPGNVRELENVIERAVVLARNPQLSETDVVVSAQENGEKLLATLYEDHPTLDQLEERYIRLVLKYVDSKKDAAAKLLGINRRTLYRKERAYGLVPTDPVYEKESKELEQPSAH